MKKKADKLNKAIEAAGKSYDAVLNKFSEQIAKNLWVEAELGVKIDDFKPWDVDGVAELSPAEYFQSDQFLNSEEIFKWAKNKKPKSLSDIFNDDKGLKICLALLLHVNIIDTKEKCLLHKRAASILVAVIVSLNEKGLTKQNLSEQKRLKAFNAYLDTNFTTIKKTGPAYDDTYKKARAFIDNRV